ncbi:hypothetical protein RHS03_08077, partial [Rhizoctonia solani]
MVSFRRFCCAIPFAIFVGVMVCAAPFVDSSSKEAIVRAGDAPVTTTGTTSNYMPAPRILVERQISLLCLLLVLYSELALFISTIPIFGLIPIEINLSSDICRTSSVLMDTFHNQVTKATSEFSSHTIPSDPGSKAAASQAFRDITVGMADACSLAGNKLGSNVVQSQLATVDDDITRFMEAYARVANLNSTEFAPTSSMADLAKCFPKMAKLVIPGNLAPR